MRKRENEKERMKKERGGGVREENKKQTIIRIYDKKDRETGRDPDSAEMPE